MGKNLSVPDAGTLIRLAEILEVSVSKLLGEKIENENVTGDVAEQLSRINEQLAMKNRRSRRIWKIIAIFFHIPNLHNSTQNNQQTVTDETIIVDE